MTRTAARAWKWPARTRDEVKHQVLGILWELHDRGDIRDDSGFAVEILRRRLDDRPSRFRLPAAANYILRQMETGGRYGACIEREVDRTKLRAIRLVLDEDELPLPRPWPAPADEQSADQTSLTQPESIEAAAVELARSASLHVVAPVDHAEPEDAEPIISAGEDPYEIAIGDDGASDAISKLLLMQHLATDVILDLAQLAGRWAPTTQPVAEPQVDDESAYRLSQALDENNRLRRNLNEVTETLRAKAKEVDAVRKALRQVQANLDALRQGSQINDSGFKALDRMMRETPKRNGER